MKKYKYILSLGLLIVSLDFMLKHYFNLSDSVSGFIMGIGVGLEIFAAFSIIRERKASKNQ